jgi:hypothetical protein
LLRLIPDFPLFFPFLRVGFCSPVGRLAIDVLLFLTAKASSQQRKRASARRIASVGIDARELVSSVHHTENSGLLDSFQTVVCGLRYFSKPEIRNRIRRTCLGVS